MTAFEGNKIWRFLNIFFVRNRNKCFFYVLVEFGVLPEIAKAVDEMEWT